MVFSTGRVFETNRRVTEQRIPTLHSRRTEGSQRWLTGTHRSLVEGNVMWDTASAGRAEWLFGLLLRSCESGIFTFVSWPERFFGCSSDTDLAPVASSHPQPLPPIPSSSAFREAYMLKMATRCSTPSAAWVGFGGSVISNKAGGS